ncbi:MAG: choice-of-anchor D domain-containing protein, partial [Bacteroidetes bacterium]|nr:choice-of-anchor D domain-containing protein [Bacteroidota bacterium]
MKTFTMTKSKARQVIIAGFLLMYMLCTANLQAQVTFLGDNWQAKRNPLMSNLTNVGSITYFSTGEMNYYTNKAMPKLWKTDGTEAGTIELGTALMDSLVASASSNVTLVELVDFNGNCFFTTSTAALCKSDGTDAGTVAIRDFNYISNLTAVNGLLFFTADDGIHGKELWKTDGTLAGTQMVKDIYVEFAPITGSNPGSFFAFGNTLIFVATTPDYGVELWKSDGTEAGTQMIKDIRSGSAGISGVDATNGMFVFGGSLYLSLNDDNTGAGLWKTDGTAAGTVQVKDINGSYLYNFYEKNGDLYFTAYTGSTTFWKSDGTTAGTIQISYVAGGGAAYNGNFYYVDNSANLWKTNGSPGNESLFKENFKVIAFVGVMDSKLIMFAESYDVITDGPERGFELWQIDGTTVSRLTDLHPGSRDAVDMENPQYIMNGAQFYFVGNDGLGYSLWKSNGTTAGTVKVKSPSVFGNTKMGVNESFTYTKADLGDKVLFPILNTTGEVWQSDGTLAGTTIIGAHETSGEYKSTGNKVYVRAVSDAHPGYQSIYRISGTPLAMTEIVASVQSTGIGAVHPPSGKLIFSSTNSLSEGTFTTTGNEPWVTDGTEAGTFRLKDIVPGGGPFGNSDPANYIATNTLVYFTAGGALYKTDGTKAGTQEVIPITSAQSFSGGATIGDLCIFGTNTSPTGLGLYKTDGTSGGTILIKALSSVPKISSEFENSVVFWQGGAWITDGTEVGTIKLTSSYTEETLSNFYRIGSLIYFIQRDKLYQTDGTMSGTTQILTNVKEMTKFDNKIFLTRESGSGGQSIITFYIFDGDINTMVEVPGSSTIQEIAELHTNGDNLFFYGFEDNTGYELYTYNIPANPTISIRYQSGTTISTIENGVQIDPTSIASNLYIGEAELGQSVTKEKYVISNTGNSALTLGTPTFTGSYAQFFAFENFPQNIAPFTVDSFNIVFTGNSHDGVEIAGVQIPTNDPDRPVFTFEVAGKSKSRPVMQVLNYHIQMGPLDYGPVVINQSKNDTIIISNTGQGNPLTFDSLVFSGSAKDEFTVFVSNQSIKPYFVHSILPEDQADSLYNNPAFSSNLKIIFTPTVSGARNATLTIYSNDTSFSGTQAIPLTGEGVCMPADSISPATTDLICLDSGEEVTLTYPQSPNETYCWGTYADWSFVGLENNFRAFSFASKLKFDSNNTPVLAVNTTAGLSVLKYENDAWAYVGGAGFATTSSTYNKSIDLEIGANDDLYLSYINSSNKASVKKFDGTDWVSVGADGFSDGLVEYLSMTLSEGKATVAYMDKSAFNRATVKQFDGTNWVTVGNTGFTLASAKYLDIESYANQLYVSMKDGSDLQGGASLYKYNGTSWDVVGTKGFSDGEISATDLEFDSNGNPIVVYAKIIYSGQQLKFTVKKFENNSWQAIGNTLFPEYKTVSAGELELGLTISNNVPYVAYLSSNKLFVMSPENGEWNVLGAESLPQQPTTSNILSSDLAVDNTGVLHCYYNGNSYFNLIKYVNAFDCLGTDNTYTTSTAGFYKVLVTNTQTNCTVQSLNTVEVRTKECVPILNVYGKGNKISIGDNTPSIDDNTQMGNTGLNTTVTREFVLINTGDGSLVFSSPISFTGANAARFSIVDQPGPILAGSSDTITVQYQSDAYEISTATLQMATNNVPLNGSYYFDVQAQTSGLSLSLTDALLTDLNNNGYVDDNDVIRYTGTLENTAGAPTMTNVVIHMRLSSRAIASFVNGSFTTTLGTIGGFSWDPTVSIASLTAGTTVTIQFDVLISEAWGQYYPGVTNQINMTADNILEIYSDDPDYPGNSDPTITPYEPQCTNPTDGGTIGIAQTICSGATPLTINNITLPSGEVGTLEYKWQSSTTSAAAGFTDIAASNSESYAPGALTTTTWYKRLAIVDCSTDWTGAVESNVIAITVPTVAPPVLTIQDNSNTTTTESTANGTITQTCTNATSRGAIWYAYTDTDKTIGDAEVTNVSEDGNFGEGTFTVDLTGLDVNTRYNVRAHATNPDGTGYSARSAFWTLANVPAAPTVDGATATTLDVTVNANSNPASTEFCINETSTNKFVQIDGSLNVTPAWQTASGWGNVTVTGLSTGVTYTFQVKARNGEDIETAYSTTAQGVPVAVPALSTEAASDITTITATGNGSITNTNGNNASNRGLIWYPYTDTDKAIGDAEVTNVSEDGDFTAEAFTASFSGLDVNSHYNARAHATNPNGTGYGSRVDFWTLANVPSAPTVGNDAATTLLLSVNVNNNPAITEFCINESSTGKFVQTDGTLNVIEVWQTKADWGTVTVAGLTTGETYTFRVKARNGALVETAYSTSSQGVPASAPSVSTAAASDITTTTATGNGSITNTNGINASERGIIWYPYTDTDKTIGAPGTISLTQYGDFTAEPFAIGFTALDVNTHYNVRALASNFYGTSYGDRIDFWTLANVPAAPTVDGATASTLDVTVNVNGNPASTKFCIMESSTSKFVQNDGTLGFFPFSQTEAEWGTITVNGLTTGVTYTFKVQAYNDADVATVFGDGTQGTPVASPTVSTEAASDITTTTATGNGSITNTNGDNASNRGLIWYPYTDTDKTIGDAEVTNVSEDGDFTAEAFTASFSGLDVNTHYNARAHATNQYGTGYGSRVDFWTLANVPSAPT